MLQCDDFYSHGDDDDGVAVVVDDGVSRRGLNWSDHWHVVDMPVFV